VGSVEGEGAARVLGEVEAADGVKLHAECHGSGPAIVFSCAFATTRENWRPQVEPLVAAGWRVLLWDYRGHGRSESPDSEDAYTIDRVVEDLARVLDWGLAQGAPDESRTAVLAGLSFGGLASLHFALAHPERVRALVLAGSGPGFKNPAAQAGWEAQIEKTAGFLETKGFAAFVERAAGTTVGRRPELPAARAAAAAIAAQNPHGAAKFGRRVAGPAPCVIDELAQISAPALVLVGEDDEQYLRAATVMAAKLPNATSQQVAGAGHILNIEETDAFNDALLGFLRGLSH